MDLWGNAFFGTPKDVVPYEIAVVANGHIPRASYRREQAPPYGKSASFWEADMFFVEVIAPK